MQKALWISIWLGCIFMLSFNTQASTMKNTEFYEANAISKVFFELTGEPEFSFYQLDNPKRIVIDLPNVNNDFPLESLGFVSPRILKVRHSTPRNPQDTRIVIETSKQLDVSIYTKDTTNDNSTNIVVELFDKEFGAKSYASNNMGAK